MAGLVVEWELQGVLVELWVLAGALLAEPALLALPVDKLYVRRE